MYSLFKMTYGCLCFCFKLDVMSNGYVHVTALVGKRRPRCRVVGIHRNFIDDKQNNKVKKRKRTVLKGSDTKQKTRSHNLMVGKGAA